MFSGCFRIPISMYQTKTMEVCNVSRFCLNDSVMRYDSYWIACLWLSCSGDLYIEGEVIPRPQYRFTEQRQTRNRYRPRYDRRRETMQVERREPPMGHQAPAYPGEFNKPSA